MIHLMRKNSANNKKVEHKYVGGKHFMLLCCYVAQLKGH